MDSSAEFWTLIGALVVAGAAYLAGIRPIIDWLARLITGGGRK